MHVKLVLRTVYNNGFRHYYSPWEICYQYRSRLDQYFLHSHTQFVSEQDWPFFCNLLYDVFGEGSNSDSLSESDSQTFWIYICLFLTALFHPKFMKNVMTLILI